MLYPVAGQGNRKLTSACPCRAYAARQGQPYLSVDGAKFRPGDPLPDKSDYRKVARHAPKASY
jgi:hypothetical protein